MNNNNNITNFILKGTHLKYSKSIDIGRHLALFKAALKELKPYTSPKVKGRKNIIVNRLIIMAGNTQGNQYQMSQINTNAVSMSFIKIQNTFKILAHLGLKREISIYRIITNTILLKDNPCFLDMVKNLIVKGKFKSKPSSRM